MPMLALARPSVNEVWPLAANQNHRFNRPANDNNITSGLCTRTKATICQQRNGLDAGEKRFYSEGEYVHSGTKKYLTLTDHLGSVRDVIDITSTPTLVGSFDYRPYGEVARSWGTVTTGYTYAGLFAQTNTGLLLSTTRAYNPANGKWLNVDPIKEDGGINLTGYVGGNPIMRIDPEGKIWAIPRLFCLQYPRVCASLAECFKNPAACKNRFCKAGNLLYHPMCDNAGCLPGDNCMVMTLKLSLAEGCYATRLAIGWFCHNDKSNPTHERERAIAWEKAQGFLKLMPESCKTCLPGSGR